MSKTKAYVFVVSADGQQLSAVHSEFLDRFGGKKRVNRLSDIEFDEQQQLWVAIDKKTNVVIAKHKDRTVLIKMEHEYYSERIQKENVEDIICR